MTAQAATAPTRSSRPRLVGTPKPKQDGKARVPEIAIRRGGEVSPAAYRLYTYYCARRNNESGGWRVKDEEAAGALDLSRSRVCEARNELRRDGWIADLGGHFIRPLVGFEEVEEPTESVESPTGNVEDSTEIVEFSTSGIDKDRARGSTSYSPPATTHTPPRAPLNAAPATAGAGVGVARPELSDFRAWAEDKKARGEKIDSAEALARARWKDGTADDVVAAWLSARRSGVVESAAPASAASTAPAELGPDEVNVLIAVVADMLRDGRELADIHEQLGRAIRPPQWAYIESVATAQARVKSPSAASAPPSPPAATPPVVQGRFGSAKEVGAHT